MHVLRLIHVPPFRQFVRHRAAKGETEKKQITMFPHIYLSWFSCEYSILVELELKMLVQQPQPSIRKRIAIRNLITAVLRI